MTESLSTNLTKAMPRVVEGVRDVVGDRAFTMIFDRGGYDGGLFEWLRAEHIGFITYQRGNPTLADNAFTRRETRFEGRRVRFYLAEDEVNVAGTGPWRRIVVGTKDGPLVSRDRTAPLSWHVPTQTTAVDPVGSPIQLATP